MNIWVISKTNCPKCERLKRYLQKLSLAYNELIIDDPHDISLKTAEVLANVTYKLNGQLSFPIIYVETSSDILVAKDYIPSKRLINGIRK